RRSGRGAEQHRGLRSLATPRSRRGHGPRSGVRDGVRLGALRPHAEDAGGHRGRAAATVARGDPLLQLREEARVYGTTPLSGAARSPSSVIAEAYRTLRTAVLLSSPDNKPQLIQVVSAQSREGKTVTAVNVTLTLAQSGGRVLIIDADLRRPRCNRIFDVPNTPGLVDYLVGLASLEKCVRPLDLRGRLHGVPLGRTNGNGDDTITTDGILMTSGSVDLLPAGTKAPNPAEILGSRRMRELLSSLRERYDYVIID